MVKKGVGSPTDIRKKLSYYHELITTCIHEAGHTISAILHFMQVSSVAIDVVIDKRTQKDMGVTNYDAALDYKDITQEGLLSKFIISDILIFNAGWAAEALFYQELFGTHKLPNVLSRGLGSDTENIHDLIVEHNLAPPGKKRYAYKKRLFNQSQRELAQYWDDVRLVAHALFKSKRLYWDDLKALLASKSKNKAFWKKHIKNVELVFEAGHKNDQKFINSIFT